MPAFTGLLGGGPRGTTGLRAKSDGKVLTASMSSDVPMNAVEKAASLPCPPPDHTLCSVATHTNTQTGVTVLVRARRLHCSFPPSFSSPGRLFQTLFLFLILNPSVLPKNNLESVMWNTCTCTGSMSNEKILHVSGDFALFILQRFSPQTFFRKNLYRPTTAAVYITRAANLNSTP